MKVKLCELQAECGQAMDSLSQTVDQENCPAPLLEQLKSLRDLQLKIQELQVYNFTFVKMCHEMYTSKFCRKCAVL